MLIEQKLHGIAQEIRVEGAHWVWTGYTKGPDRPFTYWEGEMVDVARLLFSWAAIGPDERLLDPLPGNLLKTCDEENCINPGHRKPRGKVTYWLRRLPFMPPPLPVPALCPRGHTLTRLPKKGERLRCAQCAAERRQRKGAA